MFELPYLGTIFHGSFLFLQVLWMRHFLVFCVCVLFFLFRLSFHMFVQKIALEPIDNVSLQGKEQVCLQPWEMEIMSFSREKSEEGRFSAHYKRFKFPELNIPLMEIRICSYPSKPFSVTLWNTGARRIEANDDVHAVFCTVSNIVTLTQKACIFCQHPWEAGRLIFQLARSVISQADQFFQFLFVFFSCLEFLCYLNYTHYTDRLTSLIITKCANQLFLPYYQSCTTICII